MKLYVLVTNDEDTGLYATLHSSCEGAYEELRRVYFEDIPRGNLARIKREADRKPQFSWTVLEQDYVITQNPHER